MKIEIIDFTPELASHFARLNRAWIEKLFVMEPADLAELDHPERIVSEGGAVLFARAEGEVVGTVALQRWDDETFEVVKMGVSEAWQGHGIGRRLMVAIMAVARTRGVRWLRLETNSALVAANALYRKTGFKPARMQSSLHGYARADVFLEMNLEENDAEQI
ncbi:GNAT family N-acetyltransferase [Synoicihabitans lomoniglobus]|uniref:GNAT family N-acetyltransferase n=1 Tax=Synoicihabitans lomoniglobus TaxID=2909285 RepID=A0AAE9ZXM8_9BACT|nr:GNAT family N-acetyltransferase [Opitutaceae bacterium LMO-M01]WED64810.1 GNAT family N-acetyltransferase [Opitutaceae bacterium LMO-M01]